MLVLDLNYFVRILFSLYVYVYVLDRYNGLCVVPFALYV